MLRLFAAALLAVTPARAAPAVDRAAATFPFLWSEHDLTGPGSDRLRAVARNAQFVLIGEQHNDRDTPLFARALYAVLRRENGFSHLVVEQDPLGIDMALEPKRRGDAKAIADGLETWPTLLGFASDQDLALLADVGGAQPGPDAIWGVEQAQSPVRYLEALVQVAPAGAVRDQTARLLARARDEERTRADFGRFLAYDRRTLPELKRLRSQWERAAVQDERARRLWDGLVRSAEIYDSHVRASTDHDPGYAYVSGTAREAWMKSQFVRDYRAVGGSPRALFKFGDNHIRRGVGSTGAWTLGAFVADLASFDGMDACGILVVPIGSGVPDWAHLPAELTALLPPRRPTTPVLVDLEALRPHAQALIDAAPIQARQKTRELLFGFDAIVVLPDSAPATWRLTGFAPP